MRAVDKGSDTIERVLRDLHSVRKRTRALQEQRPQSPELMWAYSYLSDALRALERAAT